MYLIIRVLCYVTMVMTVPITKYNIPKRCESIRCENDSHCMETLVLNSNFPPEAEVRCVCHGHFTGPRCEAKMILTPATIKSHYIGFTVSFHNVSTGRIISDKTFRESLAYSIQYWKNASEKSCSIATNIYSPIHGIDGLQSDTVFTLCAVTDPAGWCVPREVNMTRDKNCIVIKTNQDEDEFLTQSYVLPVAISIIVVLVLSIIVISVLLIRKFINFSRVTRYENHHKDWAKERRKEKQREPREYSLVKESSVDDLLIDNYPSPDNSIDRRTTRQAGTSTFAPVHKQSLPNVLEDLTAEEVLNDQESSQMLKY